MKTTFKLERLYYGMSVYSISDEAGRSVELPAGVEPQAAPLTELLDSGWGSDSDRKIVEARLFDIAVATKLAEITAYDESEDVNSFDLNGQRMWLPFDMRQKIRSRLPVEEDAGRTSTTLWYGTTPVQLPIALARKLIKDVELYATDCYDRTAAHKAAVMSLTDRADVEAYDHTAGYPARPSLTVPVA